MGKRTPDQLRAEAKRLLDLARNLEDQQAAAIGRAILHRKNELEKMDAGELKTFITDTLEKIN